MQITSTHLRRVAIWVVVALWALFFAALVAPSFTLLAQKHGLLDQYADSEWMAIVKMIHLVSVPWFAWVAGGILGLATGFALGVWLDVIARRNDDKISIKNKNMANALSAKLAPNQFYLGRIVVSFVKIKKERVFEITLVVYNASDITVYVDGIVGRILYNGKRDRKTSPISLPAPMFRPELNREIKAKSEGIVALVQSVPIDLIESIENDRQDDAVFFDLNEFQITAYDWSNRNISARIPLWSGFSCAHGDHVNASQVISATINMRS